jgi:hypothetical protein
MPVACRNPARRHFHQMQRHLPRARAFHQISSSVLAEESKGTAPVGYVPAPHVPPMGLLAYTSRASEPTHEEVHLGIDQS